jgi:ABC-type uncharacterized transport system permease subunit
MHFLHAAETSYINHSFNFSVASMTIWISVLVAGAFAAGSLIYPIKNLAIIVLPISASCIIFAHVWGDNVQLIDDRTNLFYWHIAIAISAFTLLTLSVMQALLFGYQELALRKHIKNAFLTWLPPLQTMESVLFRCIIAGFILLSVAISLGAIHNIELNQSAFGFNHHTVLTVISWIGFAAILYGRLKLGWRGMQVIIWTLAAFSFLLLGYFGTKIIGEVLMY